MATNITVEEAKAVVESLVSKLQHGQFGLTVNEIIKAGSLGHGTAVPGDFDLDLVIYTSSVDGNNILVHGVRKPLHQLRSFLGKIPGLVLNATKPHAVNFTYHGIDVDLLVSPNWPSPYDLWRFLQNVDRGKLFDFSVNASKWQVEFFQEQPSQVKEFIKRAKAWRNQKWPKSRPGAGKPKSYLVSLLVLRAYENARDRGVSTSSTTVITRETTIELKKIVKNHQSANIYWERYYSFGGKGSGYPGLYIPSERQARILDPANPTNNLYETGLVRSYKAYDSTHDYEPGNGNWTQLVANIDTIDLTKTVDEIQSGR